MTTHGAGTDMNNAIPVIDNELDLLAALVPLAGQRLIELGCGAAGLARALVQRHPDSHVTGLEVDARQHAKNLADPHPQLAFVAAGAQSIPFPDGQFDGALMLKSLHHVPVPDMSKALAEVARVLRPGGWLYVSEPVYDGPLNELVRLYNDEGVVRAAAQSALDAASVGGPWRPVAQHRFQMPVHFKQFDDFERLMMRPTFADHNIDDALREQVRALYALHQGPQGASFHRPMHARLLSLAP